MTIRPATAEDIEAIGQIQNESPQTAQWAPASYLDYPCLVAVQEGVVTGFLAVRRLAEGESEILNLAVASVYRRKGVASALLRETLSKHTGETWFLEVRESNLPARKLYECMGFSLIGRRPGYYQNPSEAGIVMRLQS
jgi:ribosomal-protein-alanine N-acetyltransferase